MNYYNEHDRKAAAWLRELINARIIPNGHVDGRSIVDVQPSDLSGYTQCHFFAGIGGWPLALQLAGWDAARPVWTGSCPCQPFSVAGKQLGTADERHLWPTWFRLISECLPATIFGEQVASPDALQWWDGVSTDLEGEGYACGAADLCAASVGAPHIRQRLYWVADSQDKGRPRAGTELHVERVVAGSNACRMVQPNGTRCEQGISAAEAARHGNTTESAGGACGLADTSGGQRKQCLWARGDELQRPSDDGANVWSNFNIIPCLDGKARRVESGTFPLAYGIPGREGLLRGYGNAIVPQVAAEFVKAYLTT